MVVLAELDSVQAGLAVLRRGGSITVGVGMRAISRAIRVCILRHGCGCTFVGMLYYN